MKKQKTYWGKSKIDAYFEESRELEGDRKRVDQLDLAIERFDSRKNNRRRARRQARKS